jgi:hypothetical protein
MKTILTAFCLYFGLFDFVHADDQMASRKMALDVIRWVRHGSDQFSAKYADQALFAKKKKFVLCGKIFDDMAKTNHLPEGYTLITVDEIKNIDWSQIGMIYIGDKYPDGGYRVSASLGPLGMTGYRIIPQADGYKVKDDGGS